MQKGGERPAVVGQVRGTPRPATAWGGGTSLLALLGLLAALPALGEPGNVEGGDGTLNYKKTIWSVSSNSVGATPFKNTPDAPRLTAEPGDARIYLSWTEVEDNGFTITRHQVRWKVEDGPYADWANMPNSAPGRPYATSFVLKNLTYGDKVENGITYTVQVRAVAGIGFGDPSNGATVTPEAETAH